MAGVQTMELGVSLETIEYGKGIKQKKFIHL